MVPPVQFFPYCTAGTKLYLLCNIFRIAWQVRNGTSYAFVYRFLPIFPYCTAGTWVFASRGVPLQKGCPKVPQMYKGLIIFWGPFLDHFPQKCTYCAMLWGKLFSATFQGHQRSSNESPKAPPEAKKEAQGIQNVGPGPLQNEKNEGSGAKQ